MGLNSGLVIFTLLYGSFIFLFDDLTDLDQHYMII